MLDVKPIHYQIKLVPDLERFKFSGTTEIWLEAERPVREIRLNALDLAVRRCAVKTGAGFVDGAFSMDPKKEEMIVFLPDERAGSVTLRIDYEGHINNKMAGFYRSAYTHQGKVNYIAVTQFEESDARRAFPCFDHPMQKATFQVEMIVREDLAPISNGPIIEERSVGAGKKSVIFQKTPKMSTYLVFFGIGEFEFLEDPVDERVRVATPPGMKQYAQFGLEFGRKALNFCEAYYGIKYPLPKLDLIAVPDFAFGAMENWGAITFRENLLLYFPGVTSKSGEESICEVIAHEIAHQWFGNLVTPMDWKYLWLNESFATYFGYGVVSHYFPEWDVWQQFVHGQTAVALERDGLRDTFPIEIPGGEHVVINTSTAPIIYNKGGSILRQVNGHIGEARFKDGLRRYLSDNAYACASSRDLWRSLEQISEKPISKMMKSWIEQPGYPMVEVRRDGGKLILTQKRFTYLPHESEQEWIIPMKIRLFCRGGAEKSISMLLESRNGETDIGSDVLSYKVNDGQTGFFRVHYADKSNLKELGRKILSKALSPEDQWGLQNDLYAQVKRGDVPLQEYLDFLSNFAKEDDFLPLVGIAENLFHAYLILREADKQNVVSFGRFFLEAVLAGLGYEPRAGEKHSTAILRDRIIFHAVLYGSKDVGNFGLEKFARLMRNETVHADMMRSILQVGALNGDDKIFDWLDDRLARSDSEHDRMNILVALGSFRDKKMIEKSQQYILDRVPSRNKFIPIVSMAANPYAVPSMWDWYQSELNALERFHPLHYERVIVGIVPVCGLGKETEVKAFFESYMKRKRIATDAIKLSLERLEINARLRNAGALRTAS